MNYTLLYYFQPKNTINMRNKIQLIEPLLENWTRVRVWRPTWEPTRNSYLNPQEKIVARTPKPFSLAAALFGGHVGHSSVQTARFYASIYPLSADKIAIRSGEPVKIGFIDHPQDDEQTLDPPHLMFDYFSLDTPKMEELFNDIKGKETQYKAFSLFKKTGVNCSDLTFSLLESGGFRELLTYKDATKTTPARLLFFTPNQIANILESAKTKELEIFPATKSMSVNQSDIPTAKK